MKTLNTNYIVIEYDQDKEDESKRLKEILDKNEMFFSEFLNASHFSPTVWGVQRLWSKGWTVEAAVASTKLAGASLEH